MTDLEIVLSVACGVLFVAWRHATKESNEHYRAACLFKTGLYKVAKKEATVCLTPDGEGVQLKMTEKHQPLEL